MVTPARGAPVPASVTEPRIRPPGARAKSTAAVVEPAVTPIGVPAVALQGVFNPAYVIDAQNAPMAVFWAHRLDDLRRTLAP